MRAWFALLAGLAACGPDVAGTSAASMTESGSGDESGEGTATAESGESGEPSPWCVDVHWIEPLLGAEAFNLDGKDFGVPTVDLWTATSHWDPVAEAFTTAFRVYGFDGSELSSDDELRRPGSFVAFADIDGDNLTDAIVEPEIGVGPHFYRADPTGEWSATAEPMSGYDPDVGDHSWTSRAIAPSICCARPTPRSRSTSATATAVSPSAVRSRSATTTDGSVSRPPSTATSWSLRRRSASLSAFRPTIRGSSLFLDEHFADAHEELRAWLDAYSSP